MGWEGRGRELHMWIGRRRGGRGERENYTYR